MILDIVLDSEQAIFIVDDLAMMPQLMPGSAVSGSYIRRRDWTTLTGGVYYIVLTDGTTRIRRIQSGNLLENGFLDVCSDNPAYGAEKILLDSIQSLYQIDAIVRQEVK
jgi:hypothetical protein